MGDSPDLAVAKQLMHGAKAEGFRFERIAEGPDAPVVGVRDSVGYRDEIYLAGFSDSCTAIRHKRSRSSSPAAHRWCPTGRTAR